MKTMCCLRGQPFGPRRRERGRVEVIRARSPAFDRSIVLRQLTTSLASLRACTHRGPRLASRDIVFDMTAPCPERAAPTSIITMIRLKSPLWAAPADLLTLPALRGGRYEGPTDGSRNA
jgi:hypothetical protein